ncbi:deaminase [Microbacterium sp. MEC084]|uniref:dihydrofolate reductase family protein n=1 Tax=Microbacterium sp. MEC084 TaxID=1963027 RepID=UPI00106F27CC|nr:dihydrofolate reductase family protein [Microbacterium sp. MEC084]MCD1269874.1 deaminase [Microbacterium sp. MEC084]
MTTTYTFDVFSSLDGFGSVSGGDWGGYWGKQGPELLARRLALYEQPQRMVFGAETLRQFIGFRSDPDMVAEMDAWGLRMIELPATVISSTLTPPIDWPDVTVETGDGVDVVRRLKEKSDVPLRSHGSLSLNRELLNAGLVDFVQVTIFPVLTGRNGDAPVFAGADDFDLELVAQHTLDARTVELTYRPTLH